MKRIIIIVFKGLCHYHRMFARIISKGHCSILFYLNGVNFKSFSSNGIPYIHVSMNARCNIGEKFKMNNGVKYSESGTNGKCRIDVRDSALLIIGDNVGISDTTITCHEKITVGNHVLIGVGTKIRDTDGHSLNPEHRKDYELDWENRQTAPIQIMDNVFIGANSFILKGVTIGKNSIIGAGSIVTQNIPDNEIWAGNPAKFIKKVNY